MARDTIYKKCDRCGGTGKVYTAKPNPPHGVEVNCPHCEGAGDILWGTIKKN